MVNMQNLFKVKPTEYVRGNMIYCKVCNTPKLLKHEQFGVVRVMCPCEIKAEEQQQIKEEQLRRVERFKVLQKNSRLGERYINVSFKTTTINECSDRSFIIAFNRCKKYCENCDQTINQGMGIYMYGERGTGKSHLSACIVNELSAKSIPTLFTNFYTLINNIKEKTADLTLITTIPLLVLDDIGSEKVKFNDEDRWVQEVIFQIINQRYNEKKSTIFNSNYTLEDLVVKRGFSKKTVDRIMEMSSAVIKISGSSYRLKIREQSEIPF